MDVVVACAGAWNCMTASDKRRHSTVTTERPTAGRAVDADIGTPSFGVDGWPVYTAKPRFVIFKGELLWVMRAPPPLVEAVPKDLRPRRSLPPRDLQVFSGPQCGAW